MKAETLINVVDSLVPRDWNDHKDVFKASVSGSGPVSYIGDL